jgi:hypothetical protein
MRVAGKGPAEPVVYQFKVTLKDIRPPIWRRFQVTNDITLHRLHLVLQAVMGWQNYHLSTLPLAARLSVSPTQISA